MTAVAPKPFAACALTLLLMATETMTVATRPSSPRHEGALAQVGTYASSLRSGETAIHTIPFVKGREYRLTAACGKGCDVDLHLFSPRNREIDRHVSGKATEVATIPSTSGTYHAEVRMAACPIQPCDYTLTVFAR